MFGVESRVELDGQEGVVEVGAEHVGEARGHVTCLIDRVFVCEKRQCVANERAHLHAFRLVVDRLPIVVVVVVVVVKKMNKLFFFQFKYKM